MSHVRQTDASDDEGNEYRTESEANDSQSSPTAATLSSEDDAKCQSSVLSISNKLTLTDAAVIDFCDRLSKLKGLKRWGFEEPGIKSVFDQLLKSQPSSATTGRLHLLWFVLGTACVRARKTCLHIIHDIDESTARAIKCDQDEVMSLRADIQSLASCKRSDRKTPTKIKRMSRLIAGKDRLIIAEARKVDLLYGLVARKQRMYAIAGTKRRQRRLNAFLDVGTLVGKSFWDHEMW